MRLGRRWRRTGRSRGAGRRRARRRSAWGLRPGRRCAFGLGFGDGGLELPDQSARWRLHGRARGPGGCRSRPRRRRRSSRRERHRVRGGRGSPRRARCRRSTPVGAPSPGSTTSARKIALGGLDGRELELLLGPEVGEQAALAHPDRVCESADREAVDALDRGQSRCLAEDRLAAPARRRSEGASAMRRSPSRVAVRSSLDKLARPVVLFQSDRPVVLTKEDSE